MAGQAEDRPGPTATASLFFLSTLAPRRAPGQRHGANKGRAPLSPFAPGVVVTLGYVRLLVAGSRGATLVDPTFRKNFFPFPPPPYPFFRPRTTRADPSASTPPVRPLPSQAARRHHHVQRRLCRAYRHDGPFFLFPSFTTMACRFQTDAHIDSMPRPFFFLSLLSRGVTKCSMILPPPPSPIPF